MINIYLIKTHWTKISRLGLCFLMMCLFLLSILVHYPIWTSTTIEKPNHTENSVIQTANFGDASRIHEGPNSFHKDLSYTTSANNYSKVEDEFKARFLDSWLSTSMFDTDIIEDGPVNFIKTDSNIDKDTYQKTIYKEFSDGSWRQETITYTDKFTMRPIAPNFSDLKDISVPITKKSDLKAAEPEYHTVVLKKLVGYQINLGSFQKTISGQKDEYWRYNINVKFNGKVTLYFPIKVTLEFPKEVRLQTPYQFRCTIQPISSTRYEISAVYETIITASLYRLHIERNFFTGQITSKTWKLYQSDYFRDTQYFRQNFIPPMRGENISIDLGSTQMVDKAPTYYGDPLVNFMLDPGTLFILGDKITALQRIIYKDHIDCRSAAWLSSGETNALEFSLSQLEEETLRFSIVKLNYTCQQILLQPKLTAKPKTSVYPSGDLGLNLPGISKCNAVFPSTFYYVSAPLYYDPAVEYDFTMDVETAPCEEADYRYLITLESLGERVDTIQLNVSGLPEGYTYSFDIESGSYTLAPEVKYSKLDSSGETTTTTILAPAYAWLSIYAPDKTTLAPGDVSFTLIATSLAKVELGSSNPSISTNLDFLIPEIVDVDFDVDFNTYSSLLINPGENISLKYYGINLGNIVDMFNVTFKLYLDGVNITRSHNHTVDPYGQDNTFNGEFSWTYNENNFYPLAGTYQGFIQVISLSDHLISEIIPFSVVFSPDYGVTSVLDKTNITMSEKWETNFSLTITNNANKVDNFTLNSQGWDTFLTYPTRLEYLQPNETRSVDIYLKITDLSSIATGQYNFRIIVASEGSNGSIFTANDVIVHFLHPDKTPPGIVFQPDPLMADELVYPQTSLTVGPRWRAFDKYNDTYEVFINKTLYTSDTWSNDTDILVPVTGTNPLVVGIYNITIIFYDTQGNCACDERWITIVTEDLNAPILAPTLSTLEVPVNFHFPQYLSWNVTEQFPLSLNLYKNNTVLSKQEYSIKLVEQQLSRWKVDFILKPGSLSVGTWNYTLQVQDMGDHLIENSIFITIATSDGQLSQMTTYPANVAHQSQGEAINFTATDLYPYKYHLYQDNQLLATGDWQSGIINSIPIDPLFSSLGEHDLHLYVNDLANNTYYYTWTLELLDIDAPTLLSTPATNVILFEHNRSYLDTPYLIVDDLHPDMYHIYCNSKLIQAGTWLRDNNTLYLPVMNLFAGEYNFDVYFWDTSGNEVHSSTIVTIKDVIKPQIIGIPNVIQINPLYTPDWVEMIIQELHPDSYELYKNDQLIATGEVSSEFPIILFKLSDFTLDQFNLTLKVIDEAGNLGSRKFHILVVDYEPPYISKASTVIYSEGTTGNILSWTIKEANPHNYSVYRNGELIQSNDDVTTNLTLLIDGLSMGNYEYTIIVYDQLGQSYSSSTIVTVIDITPPHIHRVADCKFMAGDTNAKLVWLVDELHPDTYIIYRNQKKILEEAWDGSDITLTMVGWPTGEHTVTLSVADASGNQANDTVLVRLVAKETVSTHKEIIQSPGFGLVGMALVVLFLGIVEIFRKKRYRK